MSLLFVVDAARAFKYLDKRENPLIYLLNQNAFNV